jgi:hypothetical protein
LKYLSNNRFKRKPNTISIDMIKFTQPKFVGMSTEEEIDAGEVISEL